MLVSSVITAAGRNSRMEKSQIQLEIPIKNKLLLPFPNENSDKTIIETTINNVLSANVDECIVVLGHFADEIMSTLNNISDERVKIIKNKNIDVGLSTSLLNGLNNCKNDYVLCVASDQPTVSNKTYNNLINIFKNSSKINYTNSTNFTNSTNSPNNHTNNFNNHNHSTDYSIDNNREVISIPTHKNVSKDPIKRAEMRYSILNDL